MDELELLEWAEAVEIHVGEFILVTPESTSHYGYRSIAALLERMRGALGIDAIFITERIDEHAVVRCPARLDDGAEPPCDVLEETFGRRIMEERPLPARPRNAAATQLQPQFAALPVIGRDGSEYGTLCARSFPFASWAGGDSSTEALRSLARLVADTFDNSDSGFATLGPREAAAASAAT